MDFAGRAEYGAARAARALERVLWQGQLVCAKCKEKGDVGIGGDRGMFFLSPPLHESPRLLIVCVVARSPREKDRWRWEGIGGCFSYLHLSTNPHLSLSFGFWRALRGTPDFERMRIFLAIELSAELRSRLGELQDDLRQRLRAARWVPTANLHLTVRFVGEVTTPGAQPAGQLLDEGEVFRVARFRCSKGSLSRSLYSELGSTAASRALLAVVPR